MFSTSGLIKRLKVHLFFETPLFFLDIIAFFENFVYPMTDRSPNLLFRMFSGYEHLIGGMSGGLASTLVCHPFDLLRVRYSGMVFWRLGSPLKTLSGTSETSLELQK